MTFRRLPAFFVLATAFAGSAATARADYVVLRGGIRLNVTGYEILGDRYRLHLKGGTAEVLVDDVVGIEPEEVFEPVEEPLNDKTPFERIIRAAADRYRVDADLIHCVIAAESFTGDVLGMVQTEVNPPAAAAMVPLAIVSLCDWPGSRRCT